MEELLINDMSELNIRRKKNLERKFGEFCCFKCHKRWHSALVWCGPDGKARYAQKCKSCKVEVYPFKISDLVCSKCNSSVKNCTCEKEKIVYNENKPHLSRLCGRCKYLGHPCYQKNLY